MTGDQTNPMPQMRYNFQTGEMETLPAYLAESLNLEHDDLMDADAYDRRAAERDGWQTAYWDGRW